MNNIGQRSALMVIVIYTIFAISSFALASSSRQRREKVYDGWEKAFANKITSILPLQSYAGKSYYMGTHLHATYLEALTFCEQIHMKLLSIHSDEENERIFKFMREASQGTEYWTGGTRLVDGNRWLWLPYGETVDYTKWSNGQPSDVNEKCLQLWVIGDRLEWNDRPCDVRFHFICERYNNQTSSADLL